MAMVASAGDAYKALDRSGSPMRLHPATGQAQRPPMNPFLSPLDDSARPASPPFQVASMDDIRSTAKELAQSRTHSMLPRSLDQRIGPHDDPMALRNPANVNRSDERHGRAGARAGRSYRLGDLVAGANARAR